MIALSDGELAVFVTLGARQIALGIPAELEAAVLENARILAGHAETVLTCALPPETEIAPEFRP